MKLSKTTTALLRPVVVFLLLFVGVTGVIGARVVDSPILFRDGFALYGGIGKALIFGLIAVILLARSRPLNIKPYPWRPELLWWGVGALVMLLAAWLSIDSLIAGQRTWLNLTLAHGGLLIGLALIGLGCIGAKNTALFWRAYRTTLLQAMIMTIAFYAFLTAVYELWEPLASVVLQSVDWLLGISGIETAVALPHTLILDKFSVTVAEYCSGVESIALFTGLYAVVGLLDWHRIHRRRYLLIFPLALLVLFALNVVRVYALIIAGYHINAEIAFNLFHTYAGMVFFILYSAVFWLVSYKYLVKDTVHGQDEQAATP